MNSKKNSTVEQSFFQSRRRFLQGAATGMGAALLGGAMLRPAAASSAGASPTTLGHYGPATPLGVYGPAATPFGVYGPAGAELEQALQTRIATEQVDDFQRFAGQLQKLSDADPRVQANVDALTKQLADSLLPETGQPLGKLGLTTEEEVALALAFLVALKRVPEKAPAEVLQRGFASRFADPAPFARKILSPLSDTLPAEGYGDLLKDPEARAQIEDALAQLEVLGQQFDTSMARASCYIGQRRVPCWLLVVVVVIIVIILL